MASKRRQSGVARSGRSSRAGCPRRTDCPGCASGGSRGLRLSSTRSGASTITRRSRQAQSTIGWRGWRSRRRGASNCSRAPAASCAPTIQSCETGSTQRAPLLSHVPPEAGAIAFVRYHHAINSTSLIERLRDESGVLVVPGDHFEMDGYLRIGFGSDPSHLFGSLDTNRRAARYDSRRRLRRCSLISPSSGSAMSAAASPGCSTSGAIFSSASSI